MCIFCKIVAGEIPSYKIYEDDKTLAFLDIQPVSYGHTLVISKAHYANLEAIDETDLSALISSVKKVGALLKEKLKISGYNVIENNDPVAGQEIPHIHFHIIPRQAGDNLQPWPKIKYGPEDIKEIISKIQN